VNRQTRKNGLQDTHSLVIVLRCICRHHTSSCCCISLLADHPASFRPALQPLALWHVLLPLPSTRLSGCRKKRRKLYLSKWLRLVQGAVQDCAIFFAFCGILTVWYLVKVIGHATGRPRYALCKCCSRVTQQMQSKGGRECRLTCTSPAAAYTIPCTAYRHSCTTNCSTSSVTDSSQ
jgi:hypothetical protein